MAALKAEGRLVEAANLVEDNEDDADLLFQRLLLLLLLLVYYHVLNQMENKGYNFSLRTNSQERWHIHTHRHTS